MRTVACILLILLSCSTVSAIEVPVESPFLTAAQTNFDAWDLNHDGRLTMEEVDDGVVNPAVNGDAAAALAVIKYLQRGIAYDRHPVPLITPELLRTLPQEAANEYFQNCRERLNSVARGLFAQKSPHLESVQQGLLGDCYFLAVIGALLHRNPESIQKLLETIPHGYRIRFHGGKAVEVEYPTDAEIAGSSTAGPDGLWLTVLEKALGAHGNQRLRFSEKTEVPTDNIGNGGFTWTCMELLTGHKFTQVIMQHDGKERTPRQIAILRRRLRAALAGQCIATTATPKSDDLPPGIPDNHAYAVLNFDAARDRITLWNPHGTDFEPVGGEGLKKGYEMKHGVFSLPFVDYVAIFNGLWIERMEDVKHRR